MKRRALIETGAACLGGALVGYAGPGGMAGDDGPTDRDDRQESTTVTDAELTVRDAGCGTAGERANVRVDEFKSQVTVDGDLTAPNACYTAELADVTYDADRDVLLVGVRRVKRADAGVCAQCLTTITYRAVVSFDGDPPGEVTVRHDDASVGGTAVDWRPWPSFGGGPGNAGFAPDAAGPVDAPAVDWSLGGASGQPALVDGVAYAVGGRVRAVDATNGSGRWAFEAKDRVGGTPAVADLGGDEPTVFAGSADSNVYALRGGEVRWERSVDGQVDAPVAVADEAVYAATWQYGDGGGRLYSFAADSGDRRWDRKLAADVDRAPAVGGGGVYAALRDGTLAAFAPDGESRWALRSTADGAERTEPADGDGTAEGGGGSGDPTAPAVVTRDGGDTVYYAARVPDGDGQVGRAFAVDAGGEVAWHADLAAANLDDSVAVADGTVLVGATESRAVPLTGGDGDGADDSEGDDWTGSRGTLHALDAGDGTERWSRQFDAALRGGPTVASGTAYAPLDGGVAAVALADGSVRWRVALNATPDAPPVAVGDRLFVSTHDGLLALSAEDGARETADGALTR